MENGFLDLPGLERNLWIGNEIGMKGVVSRLEFFDFGYFH